MSKVRMTVWIPGSLRERIEKERAAQERTLSEYARDVFEAHFGAQEVAKPASRKETRR